MSAYRQNYTPPHQRAHAFAPGAIEHHIHSRAHQRRALVRWLQRAALAMVAVSLLAGLVNALGA